MALNLPSLAWIDEGYPSPPAFDQWRRLRRLGSWSALRAKAENEPQQPNQGVAFFNARTGAFSRFRNNIRPIEALHNPLSRKMNQ